MLELWEATEGENTRVLVLEMMEGLAVPRRVVVSDKLGVKRIEDSDAVVWSVVGSGEVSCEDKLDSAVGLDTGVSEG